MAFPFIVTPLVIERYWTYSPAGPFSELADFAEWLRGISSIEIPMWFAIIDRSRREALGFASDFAADAPMIDSKWAVTCQAFEEWLDPAKFDNNGIQRSRLRARHRDRP